MNEPTTPTVSPGARQSVATARLIQRVNRLYREKDKLWLLLWLAGLTGLGIWDALFLNAPAFARLQTGFVNTLVIAILVICLTLVLGWSVGVGGYFWDQWRNRIPYLTLTFFLNLIRSIPQIVGILIGYVLITLGMQQGLSTPGGSAVIFQIALTISLFVFLELVDLIRERIEYFKQRDFYNAMRVCGISEGRIINREILWKNSLAHIFNKLISIFGATIFLLCSIDFIISVGLTTEVSSVNLPVTLGSLLAKIDSKQDVLAIGYTLTHPGYVRNLFFKHLQGISVAFLIVFTLLCIYKISNGFARRHEL